NGGMKLLTFEIGGDIFGINIKSVKEINRKVILSEIPASPPYIMGLYNMRGQIVTVFDVARMMGYSDRRYDYKSVGGMIFNCIILKAADTPDIIAFAVDAARDVISVEGACKSVPSNVEPKIRENLTGVFELEEELLLVIDEVKLFYSKK
ncbi:MAG: chemotaxis protein CheW, partial [Synergistaceae bacterium]|nr:chemotaxis protein CheW [Synergistaceae bacterium]